MITHFQSVLKDQWTLEQQAAALEGKEAQDFDSIAIDKHNQHKCKHGKSNFYDIADINFGKSKSWDIGYLKDMTVLRNEYIKINHRI